MKTPIKSAPRFAKKFSNILKDYGKTQRQIAIECEISSSAINRLCKDGAGSENHICITLQKFSLKRRRIVEILADRRAELSDEPAKSIWGNFRYAFLDEDEYIGEICPFPLDMAYACTQFGIHILDVVKLASEFGITQITDVSKINLNNAFKFISEFRDKFGNEASNALLKSGSESYPPVLLLDFKDQVDASDYVKLIKCDGKLLFGLPHLVIGDYTFQEGGKVAKHNNNGGIEFLYSLKGSFELTCDDTIYTAKLEPGQTIFVLDARINHEIKLIHGKPGRLLMIRYYPQKRVLRPGKKMKIEQKNK